MSISHEDQALLLDAVDQAVAANKLTASAAANLRAWLTEPRYADYAGEVADHIRQQKWQTLDDVFWTIIPFGTGGRRGKMYPIGSNAINDRTIGESAQGLATYVKQQFPGAAELGCALAYDTRHRSREFAELCAEIMVANGFRVHFLDGVRSTPELSFAVREKKCQCGIMVTASHNPPSDNAVKAYWANGSQVLPPHDEGVIRQVMAVDAIEREPFNEAVAEGRVQLCQQEIDAAYHQAVLSQRVEGPRELKLIYSPMHGVGAMAIMPVLQADGFSDVEVFGPHAAPDGDFPNVPGHVSNPENPATFDSMIERAREVGADVILSTDPDADRLGCAAPLAPGGSEWGTFTGNQIGALLTDFLLDTRRRRGLLSSAHYVVKTLVTSEIIRRLADSYGVRTVGNLHVGFKWIAEAIDAHGPDKFVIGVEESHGYLIGTHARDKDATVAALVMAELAAAVKAQGQTLHQRLEALFWQHGCHLERTVSATMPGSEGMQKMDALMNRLRESPPETLAGLPVAHTLDYTNLIIRHADGRNEPFTAPRGNMVLIKLQQEGNYVAVRPSGTEPKVKFYQFVYEPPELIGDMQITRDELSARLDALERDLKQLALA